MADRLDIGTPERNLVELQHALRGVVDELQPGQSYDVKIEASGYQAVQRNVMLDESLNLGLVMLEKA